MLDYTKEEQKLKDIISSNSVGWEKESDFFNWLRGGIRRIWSNHPQKISFLALKRKDIENTNEKSRTRFPTVKGYSCELCKLDKKAKDVQVDHIHGGKFSLRKMEDLESFLFSILLVTHDDLRVLCKDCHSVISYQQKNGIINFKKAEIEKYLIKNHRDESFFKSRGILIPKTLKAKKEEMRKVLYLENELSGGIKDE